LFTSHPHTPSYTSLSSSAASIFFTTIIIHPSAVVHRCFGASFILCVEKTLRKDPQEKKRESLAVERLRGNKERNQGERGYVLKLETVSTSWRFVLSARFFLPRNLLQIFGKRYPICSRLEGIKSKRERKFDSSSTLTWLLGRKKNLSRDNRNRE